MATLTLKGVNRTYRTSAPPSKIPAGEERGKVHFYFDEYSWTTDSVIGDVVTLMTIPNGARIINAYAKSNDHGSAGQYDIGWAAGATAVEAADDDGLFNEFNPEGTGGNVISLMGGGYSAGTGQGAVNNSVGLFKKFTEDVNVTITVTEASNVGTGATLQVGVQVVFD